MSLPTACCVTKCGRRSPVEVVIPRPELCTDNGAMIGAAAYFHVRDGMRYQWDLDVVTNLKLG